jgi:hypothetical protein
MATRRDTLAGALPPETYLGPSLFGSKYDPYIVAEFAKPLAKATTAAHFAGVSEKASKQRKHVPIDLTK